MDLSAKILGSDVAKTLQARVTAPILTIGADGLTRKDLAKVDCFNFLAAQNLAYILNRYLKVADIRDVYNNVHPHQLALPRLGSIALAVLGAAFESRKLGGDAPLESWLRKHKCEITTFHTIKLNEQKERAEARKQERSRKRARRDKAHTIRVERFEAKAANA
jgi:hypothetical protein